MTMMATSATNTAVTTLTEPKARQSPKPPVCTVNTVRGSIVVVDSVDVEVEGIDVEDDAIAVSSTMPVVPVGGCVGPIACSCVQCKNKNNNPQQIERHKALMRKSGMRMPNKQIILFLLNMQSCQPV